MNGDLMTTLRRVTSNIGTLALLACSHSPAHLDDDCIWTCRGCELLDRAWAVADHEAHIADAITSYLHAAGHLIDDAWEAAGVRNDAPWPELRSLAQDLWAELDDNSDD